MVQLPVRSEPDPLPDECDRFHGDIAVLAVGALGRDEERRLLDHLDGCPRCAVLRWKLSEAVKALETIETIRRGRRRDREGQVQCRRSAQPAMSSDSNSRSTVRVNWPRHNAAESVNSSGVGGQAPAHVPHVPDVPGRLHSGGADPY